MDLSLAVFVFVYAVMILGGVPGLRLDRTGAALLGAVALVAGGALDEHTAWQAIDVGTLGLLLGLMVVSAQFRLGGAYTRLVRWLAARPTSPERLLFELVFVTGAVAALLTNDVVCLAIAPVLADVCARRGLDPVPFLLALAAAANVGSAATLIGNPQNLLIGQSLHLSFAGYLLDGAVPATLGLLVTWWLIARRYRGAFEREVAVTAPPDQPFVAVETGKAIAVLLVLVLGLLFCPLPHGVQALVAAGLVLLSRHRTTRALLGLVDWQLLVLFAGLFVTNHAFRAAGHADAGFAWLQDHGVPLADPRWLFATGVVGSNVVSNVPLTMLMLPHAHHPQAGAILALATTLAGNLLLVGSIANLIVVEQATRLGIAPRRRGWFGEHLRSGVPITVATLAIAAAWLWLRSR